MKSMSFLLRVSISLLFLSASALRQVRACGPYYDCIPTPRFFASSVGTDRSSDLYRQENLRLWQALTAPEIPLEEIEQVVYRDSRSVVLEANYARSIPRNRFYAYLRNTNDEEVFNFLLLAKELEERRAETNSLWYYPSSRKGYGTSDFESIIRDCKAYKGERLADRYALQAVRALFASGRYAECIGYYTARLQPLPDDNLFKRMAQGYVAGCWTRLGDTDRANEYFACAGDLYSLRTDNPVAYMAARRPDAPELMAYLQQIAADSARIVGIEPVVRAMAAKQSVPNRGDWEFLAAYIAKEHHHNPDEARQYISHALGHRFSTDDFHDHACAYRMLLDADANNRHRLLTDLKWLESKIDLSSSDANEWNRILQHIVFAHWLPVLMRQKEYATAILLTGYADNLLLGQQKGANWQWEAGRYAWSMAEARTIAELRNCHDYGNLTFQLMGSLTSAQLASAKQAISTDIPLYRFLKRYARTDNDYFNELIGTLAIREQNYSRAVHYLSLVSPDYQQHLNIYKDGYLNRSPFINYPSRLGVSKWGMDCEFSVSGPGTRLTPTHCVKLDFARRMLALQKESVSAPTPNQRALAKIEYAIGLRNSFEECWALTQYWRGWVASRFNPALDYWEDTFPPLDFLYDYQGSVAVEERFRKQIGEALAQLTDDEARAEAQLKLNNLATIIKRYGQTKVACEIKAVCDNWRDWL